MNKTLPWVKASNELPPLGLTVLLWDGGYPFLGNLGWRFNGGDKVWRDAADGEIVPLDNVTHWLVITEPAP